MPLACCLQCCCSWCHALCILRGWYSKAADTRPPAGLQTLLFSATMPSALHEFAKAGLRDPEMVRLDVESRISPDLGLAFFSVRFATVPVLSGRRPNLV